MGQYGFKDSKSGRTAKLHDWFKSYSMWGVSPEAKDWNFALRTQIKFWVNVFEEKALSEPNNLQTMAHFLKCFWDLTSDMLGKNEV